MCHGCTSNSYCGWCLLAWFDLSGLDKFSLKDEDEKGMLASVTSGTTPPQAIHGDVSLTVSLWFLVNRIIRDEVDNGIPANRIIVGGFSQGCVLALLTGLTSEYKLAGIIGCSGWLGLSAKFPSIASDANKKTPILMCHGDADPVVKPEYGFESADKLQSMGYNVTRKVYPGLPHSANEEEIRDIAQFLQKTIPPN